MWEEEEPHHCTLGVPNNFSCRTKWKIGGDGLERGIRKFRVCLFGDEIGWMEKFRKKMEGKHFW